MRARADERPEGRESHARGMPRAILSASGEALEVFTVDLLSTTYKRAIVTDADFLKIPPEHLTLTHDHL